MSDKHPGDSCWLVLLFQFPKGQGSLRVKVWRRLQAIGAVALKPSAYVLPAGDQSREDFAWLVQELIGNGADAVVLEASVIDGMNDRQVKDLFNAARAADYRALADELATADGDDPGPLLARGRKRLADIESIDFFGADSHDAVEAAMRKLQAQRTESTATESTGGAGLATEDAAEYSARTWVTRRGVKVDRIACAWLIRRHVDPEARFRFVEGEGYRPESGREIRFDMFDAEFTHAGNLCTFEVLLERFGLDDPALENIGQIVHDIDLKDDKFGRPETAGFASLVAGIVAATSDDEERIARGTDLLEHFYRFFSQATS